MMALGDENAIIPVVAHRLHEDVTAAHLQDTAHHVGDLRRDLAHGLLCGVVRDRTCGMTEANSVRKTRDHRGREEITIKPG